MSVNMLLALLLAAILCILFYLAAGKVYDFHFKLRKDGNPLSKVLTADVKTMDDRENWIRRYRMKLLVILFIIALVPIVKTFII